MGPCDHPSKDSFPLPSIFSLECPLKCHYCDSWSDPECFTNECCPLLEIGAICVGGSACKTGYCIDGGCAAPGTMSSSIRVALGCGLGVGIPLVCLFIFMCWKNKRDGLCTSANCRCRSASEIDWHELAIQQATTRANIYNQSHPSGVQKTWRNYMVG